MSAVSESGKVLEDLNQVAGGLLTTTEVSPVRIAEIQQRVEWLRSFFKAYELFESREPLSEEDNQQIDIFYPYFYDYDHCVEEVSRLIAELKKTSVPALG